MRSRKASPSASSGVSTPPSSPNKHISYYSNGNSEDIDLEDIALSGDGKESRRLFESRVMNSVIQTYFQRNSRKELLFLAFVMFASNLMVGLTVYTYMQSPTSFGVLNGASSCPKNMVEFGNWFGNTLDSKRKASFRDMQITSKPQTKSFTKVPPQFYKTFYYDGEKISQPIARALRSRGWIMVDDTDNAHVIYTYSNNADWATELQPWQRFNFIPDHYKWNQKAQFAYYYQKYEKATGKPPSVYVPESYMLTDTKREIESFRKILNEHGKNHPWVHKLSDVNQGKGITILGPNSPELMGLPDKSIKILEQVLELKEKESTSEDDDSSEDEIHESIVQRYICNEITWNHHKFDVRMYWFVASLDPLIVLYHDGYVRVGNSKYSEKSFEDTTSHLTTHTGLGAETKATFAEFEEVLNQQHAINLKRDFKAQQNTFTPVEHVRNQFKHALGEMIEIMKDESFALPDYQSRDPNMTSENGFQFYCADFILDKDLDAWFIEPQGGCGLDEDYYFRLEMHASVFNGMVDVLEEVGSKQENNQALLPFEKSGNWEVIYADGQVYKYDGYKRSSNKDGCNVPAAKSEPKRKGFSKMGT